MTNDRHKSSGKLRIEYRRLGEKVLRPQDWKAKKVVLGRLHKIREIIRRRGHTL